HAASRLRETRDGVLLGLEHRQDHGLVDRIPLLDEAREVGGLAGDALTDQPLDLGVVLLQQPGGGERVPQQRVPLQAHPVAAHPLGQAQQPVGVRLSRDGLEPAPVEGQGSHVEQVQPQPGVLVGLLGTQLEGRAAEAEVVADLREAGLLARTGLTVLVEDPQAEGLDPVARCGAGRAGRGHCSPPPVATAAPAVAPWGAPRRATGETVTGVRSSAWPGSTTRTSPPIRNEPSRVTSSLEAPRRTRNSPGSTMRCRSGPVKEVRSAWRRKLTRALSPAARPTLVKPTRRL